MCRAGRAAQATSSVSQRPQPTQPAVSAPACSSSENGRTMAAALARRPDIQSKLEHGCPAHGR